MLGREKRVSKFDAEAIQAKLAESQRMVDAVSETARPKPPSCFSCAWRVWDDGSYLCHQPLVSNIHTNERGEVVHDRVYCKYARAENATQCGYHGDLHSPRTLFERNVERVRICWRTITSDGWIAFTLVTPMLIIGFAIGWFSMSMRGADSPWPMFVALGLFGIYCVGMLIGFSEDDVQFAFTHNREAWRDK